MKLDCFVINDVELDIQPASSRRDWMDATHQRYAYRCLPLSIANAYGWVIRCGGGFEVEWNGGNAAEDVQVFPVGDGPVKAEGHFGYGIVTISPQAMFRTEPGQNLWVSGPPNSFKDGIQPLSAVVETDWMPYSFTMNWKVTRPNQRLRFEKGEPYCFLFPVQRELLEDMEPALRHLSEDPESKYQFDYAGRKRGFLAEVKRMASQDGKDVEIDDEAALRFQRWYMRGEMPDGSGVFEGHQKSLQLRPFEDKRSRSVARADDAPGA
jgi:hypothetical protein